MNDYLTDYLEFRWHVYGDHRETARPGHVGLNGSLKSTHGGVASVTALLQQILAEQPPVVGQPRRFAQRIATLARLVRDLNTETFEREGECGQLHARLQAFRAALIPDLVPGSLRTRTPRRSPTVWAPPAYAAGRQSDGQSKYTAPPTRRPRPYREISG